jgi:hypothetical protein
MLDLLPSIQSLNVKAHNKKKPRHKTPASWWSQNTFSNTRSHHTRPQFQPCTHSGSCSKQNGCQCCLTKVACEKTCLCSDDCARRYRGCRCSRRKNLCQQDRNCECRDLNRECDPDLCLRCGAGELLDRTNQWDEQTVASKCQNVNLQRGVPRRTFSGNSALLAAWGQSGMGLYMGESVQQGDFIGEYIGHLISEDEANWRGSFYDKSKTSFLFALNESKLIKIVLLSSLLTS